MTVAWWPDRPTKASLIREDPDQQTETYRVGRYTVTVDRKAVSGDAITFQAERPYSYSTVPGRTLPNLEIDDGVMRLPIEDLADLILARASARDVAIGLLTNDEVRRLIVEGLAWRYSQNNLNDPDRRHFLAQVKEAVHDKALDKLIGELARMEWHNAQRYYAHQHTIDVNAWLHENGFEKRYQTPAEVKDFEVGGKIWNEARDDWRRIVRESFPPPVVEKPALPTYLTDTAEGDWLADPPAVEPLIEPAPQGHLP